MAEHNSSEKSGPMEPGPMRELLTAVNECLDALGFRYSFDEDELFWELGEKGGPYPAHVYIKLYNTSHELAVHIVADNPTLVGRDESVVEYLTRVNLTLPVGNFDYHYEEATIRFRSGVGFRGGGLSNVIIFHLVKSALRAWERYLPGAVEVMIDVESPASALRKIEG